MLRKFGLLLMFLMVVFTVSGCVPLRNENQRALQQSDWQIYRDSDSGFSFQYPLHFSTNRLNSDSFKNESNLFSVTQIFSPEAAEDAIAPSDDKLLAEFNQNYTMIVVSVYESQDTRTLESAVKQWALEKQVMQEALKPIVIDRREAFLFEGVVGENPQKTALLLNSTADKLIVISLVGGSGGTGSHYSEQSAHTFDQIVASVEFNK